MTSSYIYPYTVDYRVPKLESEPYQRYIHRCWFVAHQKPTSLITLKEAIKWSIIDASVRWDSTKYTPEIMDTLERIKPPL